MSSKQPTPVPEGAVRPPPPPAPPPTAKSAGAILRGLEEKIRWAHGDKHHGTCDPRSVRACTVCNARDDLREIALKLEGASP